MNSEDSKSKDSSPKKKKKSPFRWLLLLIPLAIGAFLGIEYILTTALTKQLENSGVKFTSVRVTSAGLDGIETIQISDLEFPDQWQLSGVTLDLAELGIGYDIQELFKLKKVDEVTFKTLNLSVDLDQWQMPETEEPSGDYRDIPKNLFAALPETYPFQQLEIESGSITLIKNSKLLVSFPFQLSFNETGQLKIQSSNFQAKVTFNKKLGHAVAEVQHQLNDFPGVLTPLLPDSPDIPEFKGSVFSGNLSIANQKFKDASLNLNVASAKTKYGQLSTSVFRLNCDEDLTPKNLIIETDYSGAKFAPLSAESGTLDFKWNRDTPSSLLFTSKAGKVEHTRYENFSVTVATKQSAIKAKGSITHLDIKVPWEFQLEHPYISQVQDWLKAPHTQAPPLPQNEEFVDALALGIGPVHLSDNENLGSFLDAIPETLVSGEFSLHRKPKERIAQFTAKNAEFVFPESGLKMSGVQYSGKFSDQPSWRTVKSSRLDIETIQFGELVLKNGSTSIGLTENEEGKPIIFTVQDTNFRTLGGQLTLSPTAVILDGFNTSTNCKVRLSKINSEDVSQLLEIPNFQLEGLLDGEVHFRYKNLALSFSNSFLAVSGESAKAKYDTKGELSKRFPEGSPERKQMQRVEKVLSDIEIEKLEVELDPSDDPSEQVSVALAAKHDSSEDKVGIDLSLRLLNKEETGYLHVDGNLSVFNETIPWNAEVQHPFISKITNWLHSPDAELPEIPKTEEFLTQMQAEVGPLKLSESSLVNSIIPGLPEVTVTGEVSAFRKRGENAVQINTRFNEIKIPEQEVVISNISTNPLIGWSSPAYTLQPATLKIGKVQIKKWELLNGDLSWQIYKSGVFHTPGCKFETLGGAVSLGATAIELKGSQTFTTGLLTMKNIDFEKILALADKPPLFLKGSFNGQLPFAYNKGTFEPHKGGFLQLQDDTQGHLAYDAKGRFTQNQEPGSRGWKNMNMAEQALKNLDISGITLHFLPEEDPQLPLRAVIKGSHQTEKKKINLELTLNLRGDVKEILQKAAQGKLELVP